MVAFITNRAVFYNNSSYDGNDPAINTDDASAIDTSKSAVLPSGPQASFANYTNYIKGINGVIVDILFPDHTPNSSDFAFATSIDGVNNYVAAPSLSGLTVRAGDGESGADRVTFTWADNAIENTWLRVTCKMSLGLSSEYVFWYGNQIGEANSDVGDYFPDLDPTQVDSTDVSLISANTATGAPVTNRYDINKDGEVDSTDEAICAANVRPAFMCIGRFTP